MATLKDIGKPDRHKPGEYLPMVDRSRCEAKGPCVPACPYGVLEIRSLSQTEKRQLPFFTRLRVAIHGNRQAWVVKPNACDGCGLCITACPEHAIKLKHTPNRLK